MFLVHKWPSHLRQHDLIERFAINISIKKNISNMANKKKITLVKLSTKSKYLIPCSLQAASILVCQI